MKAIFKATAVLGSASVVGILAGLVSAKVSALLLGPGGLGFAGLMTSLLGLSGMLAAMGVSIGVVRVGARALAENDQRRIAAVRSAAWVMSGGLGLVVAAAMILARTPLSRLMLGGPEHAGAVVIVAAGLLLTLSAGVQSGILNAYQRVGALARIGMLSSVIGTSLSLLVIWRWRADGIPWAVLMTCIVPWVVSLYFLRRLHPPSGVRPSRREIMATVGELLRFGAPFTASLLVGAGVIALMPVLVLHALDTEAAGYYRAASAVAVSYLGLVTASMAQDYYPRVSAVSNDKDELCRLINEQHRFVLLLGGPIILGMLALVPYLVPLLYSQRFMPSVELLEWQLIGDLFRLAAWTMAFVVMVHSGGIRFFMLELGGGASLVLFSGLGMRVFGLTGLGMGFVACAIVYYSLCWILLRRSIDFRWTRQNGSLLITLIALAAVIRLLPTLGLEHVRTPVALALAALVSLHSVRVLWRELGGYEELAAFLRRRGRRAPVAEKAS